jgi:hypothetical protein
MATKYIVNNVSGQTIDGNLTINGDVIITGTTNTRPYKVYTALLTQIGGDNPLVINTGNLTIGVTYLINDTSIGMDFTNVGAPNNNVGTYFVATGTTPNNWGGDEGSAPILNYNTGAPTVIVLENTIGNVWFDYSNTGQYSVNSDSLFMSGKTYLSITDNIDIAGPSNFRISYLYDSDASLDIITYNPVSDTGGNSRLANTTMEIRVYN